VGRTYLNSYTAIMAILQWTRSLNDAIHVGGGRLGRRLRLVILKVSCCRFRGFTKLKRERWDGVGISKLNIKILLYHKSTFQSPSPEK